MKSKRWGSGLFIFVSMALTVTVATAGVLPVGALMESRNATLDGQNPLPHTTLLSGDHLQVKDGLALVTLDQGNRMVLGRQTEASFLKDARAVTVSLSHGSLAIYHPQASRGFRIRAGAVTVSPAKGYRTVGEMAMADGALMVTAKNGVLEVEKAGTIQEVAQGKTITIATPADSDQTTDPDGKPHLKHILNNKAVLYLLLGGIAAGTALAIVAGTSGAAPAVSPVTPGP